MMNRVHARIPSRMGEMGSVCAKSQAMPMIELTEERGD